MAMLPPAPDLFSTITVRFAIGRSFSAKYRTRTSAPLPGGKAQMRRRSWLGYAWAWALVGIVPCATAAAIARPAQRANHFDSNFICFLLCKRLLMVDLSSWPPVRVGQRQRGRVHSWNASARVLRNCGSTIRATMTTVVARRTADIGRSENTLGSPRGVTKERMTV